MSLYNPSYHETVYFDRVSKYNLMASRTGTTFATLFTLIYMCKIPRALSELNGDNYF